MGITRNKHFTSSTCCKLQSLHGVADAPFDIIWSSEVKIAALSRNLTGTHHRFDVVTITTC